MWYLWLIVAGIFFIFEMLTVGFLIFWLGIGALLAMIVSLFTDNIVIQTSVFVISSAILIPLTKPLVTKFISKNDSVNTNAFSLLHKHGVVIMDINPLESSGQVKVNGEVWSAKSDDDNPILVGTEVEVLDITGVKLIVTSKITSTVN